MSRPRVHLIDGSVYIFRAYYSLPSMTAPDGTPTHAAYGYTNTLIRYLAESNVTHIAVAFDHSMQSFRNEIEPSYKANRDEVPDDLDPQFEICADVTRRLGVAAMEAPDFEADDVIATLATRLVKKGADVVVVTSDKDLTQLVRADGRVVMYDLGRDHTFDAKGVREKFGVDPDQIPDYLGLVGDTVDNLPGVPGIGPKTAAAALRAFGRIERIPADPAAWADLGVRGAARAAERIEANRERALRTRELATVRRDVPGLRSDLRSLSYRGAHRAQVAERFEALGWGKIATRIPRWRER